MTMSLLLILIPAWVLLYLFVVIAMPISDAIEHMDS